MNELKFGKRQKQEEQEGYPSEIYQLRVDSIRPNRSQPRAVFDNNAIIRLADSIRRYGILQPLTVRPAENDELYAYELIAGERRLRAAKMLGYFTVPCVIVCADELMSAEMAIIENLLREDLNMFEQARGFKRLIDQYSLTQDEVARRMSLSQSAVANKLRLLKLGYDEQKLILETELTERHARALLRLPDDGTRIETIRFIASEKMNVRQTEEYIDGICGGIAAKNEPTQTVTKSFTAEIPPTTADGEVELILRSLQKQVEKAKKRGRKVAINVMQNIHTVDISIKVSK